MYYFVDESPSICYSSRKKVENKYESARKLIKASVGLTSFFSRPDLLTVFNRLSNYSLNFKWFINK